MQRERFLGVIALFSMGWIAWSMVPASAVEHRITDASRDVFVASEKQADSSIRPPERHRVTREPRRISAERRAELWTALMQAKNRARKQAPTGFSHPLTQETRLTTKEYIQEQLDGVEMLIAECFYSARKLDPSLGSKLPVAFTISGEPGVGGLVTEAEIPPEMAKNKVLAECVRETLFALEIDPPELGANGDTGDVGVRYAFEFDE